MLPPRFNAATNRPSAVSRPPSSISNRPAANASTSRSISEGAPTFTFASSSCAAFLQAFCLISDGPGDGIIFLLPGSGVRCPQAMSAIRHPSCPLRFYCGSEPGSLPRIVPFEQLDAAPSVLTGLFQQADQTLIP